ncbi:MAG: Spi family protease inhibitor, partial [Alistipes sp.]|nr:Spi family protease inhibitor [Alistipes sp.]
MKRLFIGLSLAFMVLSCAKDESILSNNIENDFPSTFVTPEMALEEVENFLKEVSIDSRAYANKQISSIYSTREMTNTRTGDAQDADPFIYVVNFEGNQGYALVSGDTRMQPILAVTDTGSLPQGTVIDNPGMIMMLSNIETDYRMALGLPVEDVDGNIVSPIGTAADGSYI